MKNLFRLGRVYGVVAAFIFCTAARIAVAQPPSAEKSRHLESVEKRGRVLPMDMVGTYGMKAPLKMDGNLDEGSLALNRCGLFFQDLDHLAYQLAKKPDDAACVRLLRGSDALYVVIRVVDASVYNVTKTEAEYIRQDCVELFFDVRPTASVKTEKLGDSTRSPGFFQLFFVPPTAARGEEPARPARWCSAPAQAAYGTAGPVDVAGSLRDDGYDLEIRIPYASLGVTRERFNEPIGFEMLVDDMDIDGQTGKTTASDVYSWGGLLNCYADPSHLAAAAPKANDIKDLRHPAMVRAIPARLLVPSQMFNPDVISAQGNNYLIRAGAVWMDGMVPKTEFMTLRTSYAASPFDTATPARPPKAAVATPAIRNYPALGIQLAYQDLTSRELPGGRYTCDTVFTFGGPEQPLQGAATVSRFQIRYYGREKDGNTTLLQVPDEPLPVDPIDAFKRTWILVEPESHYPGVQDKIAGRLTFSEYQLPGGALWTLSQEAARVVGEGKPSPFALRVSLSKAGEKAALRTVDVPFRSSATRYELPAETVGVGDYDIRVVPVVLEGTVAQPGAAEAGTPETVPFSVVLPRAAVLPAAVVDAPQVAANAREVGSPNRGRHPLDDAFNAPQRSVAALHAFKGRIYVGSGIDYEYRQNVPPTTELVDIWSFLPESADKDFQWRKETTLASSLVSGFRTDGDRLYVSSLRYRWWRQTFPFHAKTGEKWETLAQLPTWQLNDVLPLGGKLYAAVGAEEGAALMQSADGGRTWTTAAKQDWPTGAFDRLTPVPGGLLATADIAERGAALIAGDKVTPLRIDLFPGFTTHRSLRVARLQAFAGGVVYTVPAEMDRTPTRRPLFYLQDLTKGAVMVEPFKDGVVQDIKVHDGRCYVLTAKAEAATGDGGAFIATVYSTDDLKTWTRQAAVTLPALPNALEVSGKTCFVGLANRRFGAADAASGSVWEIRP